MRYRAYAHAGLFLMASLSFVHGLDYEQKLLIENQGLDLTMLKGHPASHGALTNESGQLSNSSSSDVDLGALNADLTGNSSEPDALSSLLGNSNSEDISSGLDSLLGNDTAMPKKSDSDGLDNLLSELNAETSPKEPNGLEGLNAILDKPAEPEPEAAGNEALAGLDSLLADNNKPAANTPAPSGLSGLDSILGGLGESIEIEEVKIEGLGVEEKKPEPKKVEKPKEKPKPVKKAKSKNTATTAVEKGAPKTEPEKTITVDTSAQADITPLERKLYVKSGTEFGQLLDHIAQLGGWQLKTSSRFNALSSNKVGLNFQNVPLKFVLKWLSTQTGLQYKLSKETLSI